MKNHTNYHNLSLQHNTDEKYVKTVSGQIVIPVNDENLIKQVLYISHDMSGHFGQQKTMSIIERSIAIPGLYKITREYINQCEICLTTNAFPSKEGRGAVTPYYSRPGESIAMDLRGKLPTINGFNHIMMIVDANTKKWYTKALKGCKTEDVIQGLEEYMANNPTPKHIRLDQARGHISGEMKTWATRRNIELDFLAAGHHSANSLAERSIGTLNLLMSKHLLQRNTKDWTQILNETTDKYNLCPNMSGKSPIENERESERPIDILSMKLRERGETSQKKDNEGNKLVGKNATYKLRNREIFGPRNSLVSKIIKQRKHQVQLANGLWRHKDQLRIVKDKKNPKRSVELE
uniref:RNA-directed DNA polymerase n=1 Tax=Strongyloides venezuelensis TaxID=75913 RepID=A0A0K0FFF4_STRVS